MLKGIFTLLRSGIGPIEVTKTSAETKHKTPIKHERQENGIRSKQGEQLIRRGECHTNHPSSLVTLVPSDKSLDTLNL